MENSSGNRNNDIRYNLTVNETTFQNAINASLTLAVNNYDLNDYNCTDYPIDVFNVALLAGSKLSNQEFSKPNDFYDTLNTMSASNSAISKDQSGNNSKAPASTNCN